MPSEITILLRLLGVSQPAKEEETKEDTDAVPISNQRDCVFSFSLFQYVQAQIAGADTSLQYVHRLTLSLLRSDSVKET